jgi:hypothetical protein
MTTSNFDLPAGLDRVDRERRSGRRAATENRRLVIARGNAAKVRFNFQREAGTLE